MNFDATPVSSNEVNAYQVEYKHFATVEILMCKLCKGVCSVACLNDEYGRIVNMLNDVRQPDTERERARDFHGKMLHYCSGSGTCAWYIRENRCIKCILMNLNISINLTGQNLDALWPHTWHMPKCSSSEVFRPAHTHTLHTL